MPFIIDGHNLIGAMADIDLADPDDEEQLLVRLHAHVAEVHKTIHIYFDRRAPGERSTTRRGRVIAHFVDRTRTADDAIRDHVERLHREAANWTVVSSDHAVLNHARRHGARTLSSQEFLSGLHPSTQSDSEDEVRDVQLSPEEIRLWEQQFHNTNNGSI